MVASITLASGSARLGMAAIVLFLGVGIAILIKTPYPADQPVE
jgi:UMF1 family MFS transporter